MPNHGNRAYVYGAGECDVLKRRAGMPGGRLNRTDGVVVLLAALAMVAGPLSSACTGSKNPDEPAAAPVPAVGMTLYVENHNAQSLPTVADYRLDFFLEPIPEPNAFSLLLVGAGFVGLRCWRNKR